MRTVKVAATAAIAVSAAALGLAAPASAHPVNWGAVSFSPGTGRLGYATNFPDEGAAVRAADEKCTGASFGFGNFGARDCRTVVTFTEGCASVSESNLIWVNVMITGFGKGATPAESERNAIADVERVAPGTGSAGARILDTICNQPPD